MTLPFCQFRALVADRDRTSQRLMAYKLETLGMAVVLAGDGKEALARFCADHFDLVFMCLDLPEMDGFACAAAILRHENAFDDDDHTPIIAMTTLARSQERKRCMAAGMDCYLEKPASFNQLQVAVQAFADPDSLLPARPPLKWSRRRVLDRVGGDENLLSELIAIFVSGESRLLADMDRAVLDRKPGSLQLAAHRLQEELDYLGAADVSETARKLVATAEQTDFLGASEIAAALRFQLSATHVAMRKN